MRAAAMALRWSSSSTALASCSYSSSSSSLGHRARSLPGNVRYAPPVLLQAGRGRRRLSILAAAKRLFTELRKMKDEEDAGPIVFSSPLSIVLYPDPRLRARNIRVNMFDDRLEQLVGEMLEIMYRTDGVGLSAPQVGVNARLMVFNPAGEKGKGKEYVFVNPRIVKYGKELATEKEGCLSFLSAEADVERPISIRVEAQDIHGKKYGTSFRGWTARIFQHEYDHLQSVLYFDRMTPEAVSCIEKDLVKLEEEYERRTGKPRPETILKRTVAAA